MHDNPQEGIFLWSSCFFPRYKPYLFVIIYFLLFYHSGFLNRRAPKSAITVAESHLSTPQVEFDGDIYPMIGKTCLYISSDRTLYIKVAITVSDWRLSGIGHSSFCIMQR
jgi:hypothetical protein